MPNRPATHRPAGQPARAPERRPSAAKRGYGRQWRAASQAFLAEHPLCEECQREGRVVPAVVVDHRIPHRGDPELFWDVEGNWSALCTTHHNRKTARGQ